MVTHPQTPPESYTGVTNRIALGLPLVAALLITVTNPLRVFDEVAVQMKCDVTVTAAAAGCTPSRHSEIVVTDVSSARPHLFGLTRDAGFPMRMSTPLSFPASVAGAPRILQRQGWGKGWLAALRKGFCPLRH